ncbi:hypothetical protein F66182_4297 [Fusarium sp. NRRL 66182]|nr:hypothetical protein F66182_4297 [Fusarium sp. NRRL 66182]
MSALYRPSTKATAQAAMAKLSPAQRAAREESDLGILRASIERTLWCLDPDCKLAAHLRETMSEIRRHSLAALLSEKAYRPCLESPPRSPQASLDIENDSVVSDDVFERASQLGRSSIRKGLGRVASERSSRLRRGQPLQPENGSNLGCDKIIPSVETSSARTPVRPGSAIMLAVDDTPEKGQSATAEATSEINASAEEHQPPTKKRTADDGNDASPVAKRVRTWLGQLTGGYME